MSKVAVNQLQWLAHINHTHNCVMRELKYWQVPVGYIRTTQKAYLFLSVYFSLHSWRKILYGRFCKGIPWTSFKSDDPSGTNNRLYSQLRFITAKNVEKGATGKWNVSTIPKGLVPASSSTGYTGPAFPNSELQRHVWVVLYKEVPWNLKPLWGAGQAGTFLL